jgi:hypothetical protein
MDFNTTHAEIYTLLGVTALGVTTENSTTAWFSFQEKNFAWPGATFNQTYEGDFEIEGYGVRHCYVAENVSPGLKVLLFIDNIFRFTQAGSEVSALLGRMPSAVGYQPNLATELGELETPILLTCTLCVWKAADAMVAWLLAQKPWIVPIPGTRKLDST